MFDGKESIEFADIITADRLICAAGLLLLARWLLTTSLGRKALADSPPRRNNMPFFVPLIPLVIWFGPVPLASMIAHTFLSDVPAWKGALLDNCIFGIGQIVTTGLILILASIYFARRLKGFGLNVRTTVRDFVAAFVNLLAVWPLVMAAMIVTISLMTFVTSRDYQMERHQELNLIIEHPQLPLRVMIIVVAVIITPVMEELLFRGLFQTAIRSFFEARMGPQRIPSSQIWFAIVISSAFFAIMHPNPGHFPALFVLGIGMGYAYEKSGSLLRPIFIHALFNATTIAATLSQ